MLGVLNSIVTQATVFTYWNLPGNIALDLIIIYAACQLRRVRKGFETLGLIYASCASIIIGIILSISGNGTKITSFLDLSYAVNMIFTYQLVLITALCFSTLAANKGWFGCSKPVNYFKLSRERNERQSTSQDRGCNPTAW